MKDKVLFYYVLLCALLCACLAIAAGLGSKIILIFSFPGSATLLPFSVTFLITDVISEVYGKKAAKKAVWIGLWSILLVFVFIKISILWPSAPFWKDQAAYESIFGGSLRIIIGGVVAYLVSQFHDVWAYHFLKKLTKNKHMWIRNNVSTMSSQLINTIIFVTIAFSGVQPVGKLIIGHYIGKVIVAALDTPFIYLGVHVLRKTLKLEKNQNCPLFEGQ